MGASSAPGALEAMKAYRARLIAAGRMLEAKAVDRCIAIAKGAG